MKFTVKRPLQHHKQMVSCLSLFIGQHQFLSHHLGSALHPIQATILCYLQKKGTLFAKKSLYLHKNKF